MPHLTLHHTANLDGFDSDAALVAANRALIASGQFQPEAIKSRALLLDHWRVGDADTGEAFVHALLTIMPGRSEAVRQSLAQAVHDALETCLPKRPLHCQLCVEIGQIEPSSYIKTSRRLAGGTA